MSRKQKLSDPRDAALYRQTFLEKDAKGYTRRYIEGPCVICGTPHRVLWGNFTRGAYAYAFRHLKCAQHVWNSGQYQASLNVSPEAIAQRIAKRYAHGARARGLEWRLSTLEVVHLTQALCFYCGAEPQGRVGKFVYNGIDRKDNAQGYTLGNCVTCCKRCNFLKRDMLFQDWIAFLNAILINWKG